MPPTPPNAPAKPLLNALWPYLGAVAPRAKAGLAAQFGVSVRTIERDLRENLGDSVERTGRGRWRLRSAARSQIPTTYLADYAALSGTVSMFPDRSLSFKLKQVEDSLQSSAKTPSTHVQPGVHEDLHSQAHQMLFELLQEAITGHHPCSFSYKGRVRQVQPYRLIHRQGVWYLAAVDGGVLKNFSFSRIEAPWSMDEHTRFTPEVEHQRYIEEQEGVWFTTQTTPVMLRVSAHAAHYFANRNLLPRQSIREDTDGTLIINTHINHIDQLLPLVRAWLPHVRIISPQQWHETLLTQLREALQLWE